MIAKKVETKIRDSIITATRSQGSSLFSQEPGALTTLHRPRQSNSRYSTHVRYHSTNQQFSSSSIETLILSPYFHMAGPTRHLFLTALK